MASGSGLAEGRAAEAGAAVDTLPSRSLLGFPLCTAEPAAILGWLDQRLADKVQTHVVTLNPEMVLLDRMRARASLRAKAAAEGRPPYDPALHSADLFVADGVGITWAARRVLGLMVQ